MIHGNRTGLVFGTFFFLCMAQLWGTAPQARIINPGSDFVYVAGQQTILHAFSDSENVTYKWTFSTGEVLEGQLIDYTLPMEGPVSVTMVATNAAGEADRADDRLLHVVPINEFISLPRVVELKPSQGAYHPGEKVNIDAVIEDPEGDGPFEFHWFWLEDGRPRRFQGEGFGRELPLGEFPGSPDLIYLMVADRAGHFSFPLPIPIYVVEGNRPPLAEIAEPAAAIINVALGSEVSFRAEGRDPEGDEPLSYRWVLPDGTFRQENPVNFRFEQEGSFAVSLTSTDAKGNESFYNDSIIVRVQPPNQVDLPITAVILPLFSTRIFAGDPLILSGVVQDGTPVRWLADNVASGERAFEVAGKFPGRVTFPEAGLFRVHFQAEILGSVSAATLGNTRWVAVHARDDNGEPELGYISPPQHLIARNEQATLSVAVSDPEGDEVSIFWAQEGTLLERFNETETFPFQVADEEFFRGLAYRTIETLAIDARGKSLSRPLFHSIVIYKDRRPPMLNVNERQSGSTVFIPLGEDLQLNPSVTHGDGLDLVYRWESRYQDRLSNFFESDQLDPGSIRFDEPGLASVVFNAVTRDESLQALFGFLLWIHVYDPQALPKAEITKPNTRVLQIDVGTPISLEGIVTDANFQTQPVPGVLITETLSHQLTWRIVGDMGYDQTIRQNEPLELQLPEAGFYSLTLQAENNLGLVSAPSQALQIEVKNPRQDADFEPNNSRATAWQLAFGNVGGLSVSAEDPVDWYALELEKAGSAIELSFDLTAATGPVGVEIYLEEKLIQRSTLLPGTKKPFIFVGGAAGIYYLRLHTDDPNATKRGLAFAVSVSVSIPRLTFPYPKSDEVEDSLLTLINPFNAPAGVILAARNPRGEITSQTELELAGNGHMERSVADIFGRETLDIAWIQVLSDTNIIGLSTTLARDGETAAAEPAIIGSLDELVIPHIAQNTALWFTKAAIANTSGTEVQASFNSKAGEFELTRLQGPNQSATIDFESFFEGGLPQGSEWGRFIEKQAKAGLTGLELFGTKIGSPRLAALNLSSDNFINPNFTYKDRNIYFPHVAKDRVNFWTGIAFVNTDEQAVDVKLLAYNDLGEVVAEETFQMEPAEKRVGIAQDLFPQLDPEKVISWIQLQTNGPIAGYELFGDNSGANTRLAGFPALRGGAKEVIFQKIFYEAGRYWTGIAAVNISPQDTALLTYEAYDGEGNLLASVGGRTIGPYQKELTLVEQIFGGNLPENLKWIRLKSTQPLVAFELFGDLQNKFLAGCVAQ